MWFLQFYVTKFRTKHWIKSGTLTKHDFTMHTSIHTSTL